MKKIKLLVTCIGSLVGQNIIDVLEYPPFFRRDKVDLIGTNSIASNPNNFKTDRCYLVPNTSTDEFKEKMIKIIREEMPDLILSGRDEDTETIAHLMANNQELKGKLPYGKTHTLTFALDKLSTWEFTQKYNLPFAATFVLYKTGDINDLKVFVETYGYPLIAKPIRGFASKGVYFAREWRDLERLAHFKDYMFQEYLGDASTLQEYFNQMDGLTPLFAHAPNIYHHSCHTVISPNGKIDEIFISRNDHNAGVTVGFKRVYDSDLKQLATNYAKAIYHEGGWGPVTVQFRKDKNGNWKVQEINMRTNGNTFPRFLMGQDDLGLIMQGVLPELNFPVYNAPEENKSFLIGKTFFSNIMLPENIDNLKKEGVWSGKI